MKILYTEDNSEPMFQNYNSIYKKIPYCYILPINEQECKDALLFAKLNKKFISIRSGGHSCEAHSVLDGRVAIYMTEMNKILSLDKLNSTITVQSGVKWKDFYEETTKYGLAVTGGGCPSVCVGGLILGGGSNYLASSYGYSCDSVLECKVLLENGEIVTCSKSNEYSDLFWAMMGSGHAGFGLALEFKLQLYPIEPILYFNIIYVNSLNDFECFLESILKYTSNSKRDNRVHLTFECRQTFNKPNESTNNSSVVPKATILKLTFFFNGPPKEGEIIFKDLYNNHINAESKRIDESFASSKTLMEIINLGTGSDVVRRSFTKNRMVESSSISLNHINKLKNLIDHDIVSNSLKWNDKLDHLTNFSITFYYHGGKQNEIAYNENSFFHRSTDWAVVVICSFISPLNDSIFSNWKDQCDSTLSSISKYVYQNYPDNELKDWQNAYYAENYKRLQEIKSKYDPNNYFNSKQSIELL